MTIVLDLITAKNYKSMIFFITALHSLLSSPLLDQNVLPDTFQEPPFTNNDSQCGQVSHSHNVQFISYFNSSEQCCDARKSCMMLNCWHNDTFYKQKGNNFLSSTHLGMHSNKSLSLTSLTKARKLITKNSWINHDIPWQLWSFGQSYLSYSQMQNWNVCVQHQ